MQHTTREIHLKVILKTLSEIGYTVHHKVLNASDFEVPQKRERIYLIAIRNDLKTEYTFPLGTKKTVLLEDFLGDTDSEINKVIINKKIKWNDKNIDDFIVNKSNRIGTYGKGGQGERVYNPKGHAITLSSQGGGIGAKTGMYKVGNIVRRLTPKECAKISGYPETYIISQTPNIAYKQLGNTVVTNVIQSIVKNSIEQGIFMTDLAKIGSKTAKDGFQNERDVVTAFLNWRTNSITKEWLTIMEYHITNIEWIKAEVISGHKADVVVEIKVKLKSASTSENIQVKLVTNGDYNQIDKRKADRYAEMWSIPDDILNTLKRFSGELPPTCENPKDTRRMFVNEFTQIEQDNLLRWLNENKVLILTDVLKGRGQYASEWFLIIKKNDATMNDWILQPINKVLNHYSKGDIVMSPRGSININGITLQRKGVTPDPESLQFKIKPSQLKDI